jgi:uncharacterized protein with HEPN domain
LKKDDTFYLTHILDAISRIEEYSYKMEDKGFKDNRLVQDGIIN